MKRLFERWPRLVTGASLTVLLVIGVPLSRAEEPGASGPGSASAPASEVPGGLVIRSGNSPARVWAEVSGTLPFPFGVVVETLSDPAAWCEFLSLHVNTKACVHGSANGAPLLVLYSGRKYYEPPEDAFRLDYRFDAVRTTESVRVSLNAARGPLGTRDHQIEIEATSDPAGTAARVLCSYVPSTLSRAGTSLYLTTLGRGKEGFSRTEDPATGEKRPVGGVRGIIERNVVRYCLAVEAFLTTRLEPPQERQETRRRTWFELTARYPQLYELDRETYLDNKRRESVNQQELQRAIESGRLKELPGAG